MPTREQLLFVKGTHAVRARKLNYLRDPEFRAGGQEAGRALFDENPMHLSGRGAREDGRRREKVELGGRDSLTLVPEGETGRVGDAEGSESDGAGDDFTLGFEDSGLPEWLRDG